MSFEDGDAMAQRAQRTPLSRERIIAAAMQVADDGGLAAVSMRSVGKALGAEAMSLYHHVAGKEALINLLADAVFAKIELPRLDDPWREGITRRSASARAVARRSACAAPGAKPAIRATTISARSDTTGRRRILRAFNIEREGSSRP